MVSKLPSGSLHRYSVADLLRTHCAARARSVQARGQTRVTESRRSDGTDHRHLEAYFAVPCIGAVLHTLNLRLHPSELGYIASHARGQGHHRRSVAPAAARRRSAEQVRSLERVIVMPDDGRSTSTGAPRLRGADRRASRGRSRCPTLDERSGALMCYTSGTTGHPEGRALLAPLDGAAHADAVHGGHARRSASATPSCPSCRCSTRTLGAAAHAAIGVGAKLVLPGPASRSADAVLDLMAGERVTFAGGVPTIWLGMLALLDEHPKNGISSALRMIVIGGAAAPPAMIDGFERRHGAHVTHAWGMTETNPLAHARSDQARPRRRPTSDELARRATQGYPVPFVEQRHVDDDGRCCRGTARRWASSRCAARGWRRRISASRRRGQVHRATAGSRPATS